MKLSEQLAGKNFGPRFSQAISAADDQIEYLRAKGLNEDADLFARQISDKINRKDESIASNLSALGQVYSVNLKATKPAGEKEVTQKPLEDQIFDLQNNVASSVLAADEENINIPDSYISGAVAAFKRGDTQSATNFSDQIQKAIELGRKVQSEENIIQGVYGDRQATIGERSGVVRVGGQIVPRGPMNQNVFVDSMQKTFGGQTQPEQTAGNGPVQPGLSGYGQEFVPTEKGGRQVTTRIDPTTGRVEIVEEFDAKQAKEKRAQVAKESKAVAITQDLFEIKRRYSGLEPQEGVVPAMARIVAGKIPGTETKSLKKIIDRVKSSLTLEEIQSMRQNSLTGAALGNVSDKDVEVVRDAATSLEESQTPEAFNREWLRLTEKLLDVAYGSKNQREMLVKEGKLSQDQNEEIDLLYPSETINAKGEIVRRKGVSQTGDPTLINPEVDAILDRVEQANTVAPIVTPRQ